MLSLFRAGTRIALEDHDHEIGRNMHKHLHDSGFVVLFMVHREYHAVRI